MPALIEGLPAAQALIADRGYDAQAIVDLVAQSGGQAHIPTQRDRKIQRTVDPTLYRERNLVERFFNKRCFTILVAIGAISTTQWIRATTVTPLAALLMALVFVNRRRSVTPQISN